LANQGGGVSHAAESYCGGAVKSKESSTLSPSKRVLIL
jgi:hypothetical protein